MQQLLILLKKEFTQIRRNPFLPRLIVAFPIMIMLVMPWVTTMDVRNVSVVIVDEDSSSLSRRIVSDISASDYFKLNTDAVSYNEALALLEDCKVDVILSIPQNFERDLTQIQPQKLSIDANAVNATKGSLGSQYLVQTVALTVSNTLSEQGREAVSDWVVIQNRYNETLNYRHLMIPALMIMLIILICGFLSAINIVVEKENGTIEQINVTPVGRFTFILAKLIPYWFIGLLVISIAMLVARLVYGLAPVGSLVDIYLATMLFILGFSGFGVAIANKSDNIQQTMFVMFFFVIIFMLLSGLLTPISSMPEWAQWFTLILPPRYYIEIMRAVYLKGTSFMELWHNFVALGIFAVIFNLLAAITYRKQS